MTTTLVLFFIFFSNPIIVPKQNKMVPYPGEEVETEEAEKQAQGTVDNLHTFKNYNSVFVFQAESRSARCRIIFVERDPQRDATPSLTMIFQILNTKGNSSHIFIYKLNRYRCFVLTIFSL
jgi:hypothetical protein